MSVKCFLVEPTGRMKMWLRRYKSEPTTPYKNPCPLKFGYHNAEVFIGEAAEEIDPVRDCRKEVPVSIYEDDPRWPAQCACGYVFDPTNPDDKDQVFTDAIYRRADTGEERGLREWSNVEGAMWNAKWLADFEHGPDGQCLIVVCPGGHQWRVDGTASNCDSPCRVCGVPYRDHIKRDHHFQESRPHKCWVRHGTPPLITVDKNGVTCGAGAGSILVPNWHGFLRNGVLEP